MKLCARQTYRNAALAGLLKASLAVIGLSLSAAALADRDHGDHHHGSHYHGDAHWHRDGHWHGNIYLHGGYVAPPYAYRQWRDGYWYRGYRGGRFGWWWSTGGYWYPYPQPIYPYPEPYQPPVVWQQRDDVDADSDADVDSAPAAAPEEQAAAPAPQMWYYCRSAEKYFPYVSSCPEAWQQVPVTPDSAPGDLPQDDRE